MRVGLPGRVAVLYAQKGDNRQNARKDASLGRMILRAKGAKLSGCAGDGRTKGWKKQVVVGVDNPTTCFLFRGV